MANLIDKDYFVGERNIPDTDKTEVVERLNFFITKYEEELLRDILGNALYKAFIEGIGATEPAQKWKDLRDGLDYTDQSNKAAYWIGLRNTTKKQSLIANYVYYWWLRDKVSVSTSVGEVQQKSESGEKISPAVKQSRAWNEMVKWIDDLILFLDSKEADYPEWSQANRYLIRRNYRPINSLGI